MNQAHRNCCWGISVAAWVIVATLVASVSAARDSGKAPGAPMPASSVVAPLEPKGEASARAEPKVIASAAGDDTNTADDVTPSGPNQMPAGVPADRIETSVTVPPSTIEVTTLDSRSVPAAGVHIELVRDRQSVSEGNTSTKWQATTDASGNARFSHVPSGSDSQYRVVAVDGSTRYGTRPFPVETRAGTKVVFHVYPLVKNLKDSIVAGTAFIFVEPRDEVLSIEYMQQFYNLGQTVFDATGLALGLPKGWKAFATNPTDADLSVIKADEGVSLVGVLAPGQHSVAFTFQVPSSNRERVELELNLWPNTAEAQIATLARPGLELQVEGFPTANVTQGNGRQPMLVTGQSFTRDKRPPETLRVEVAGLPVVGLGRWVAAGGAAMLALGALLMTLRERRSSRADDTQVAAARARIIDELTALERAHRQGQVGEMTFADTQEVLLSAFVRIERESVSV